MEITDSTLQMVYGHYINMFNAPLCKIAMNVVHLHISKNPCICVYCLWWSAFLASDKSAPSAYSRNNQGSLDLARVWPMSHGPIIQSVFGNDHLTSPSPSRLNEVVHHPVGTTPGTLTLNQEQVLNSRLPRSNMSQTCTYAPMFHPGRGVIL